MDRRAQFRQRLQVELTASFNLADLNKLAQFELNVVLANVVFVQTSFENVAFEFVGWCHRYGKLGEFVKAAARCRPELAIFQALAQEFDQLPAGATPTSDDLSRFNHKFTVQLCYLEYLQAYKKLHDILHDLDGEIHSFQEEADARATSGTPVPAATAEYLQGKVVEAQDWRTKTEHPTTHLWVDRFAKIVDEFLGPDVTKHDRAFRKLKNLPAQELELLNGRLTDAAHRVELSELGELLDWQLEGLPILAQAVSDFRRACVRVRDLTAAHDICQFVDREFRSAEEGVKTPADLDNWDEVHKGLCQVGVLRPSDLHANRVLATVKSFAEGGPAATATFNNLQEKFAKLFEVVDKELLDAIQPLLSSAFRLSTSLGSPP